MQLAKSQQPDIQICVCTIGYKLLELLETDSHVYCIFIKHSSFRFIIKENVGSVNTRSRAAEMLFGMELLVIFSTIKVIIAVSFRKISAAMQRVVRL